MVPDGKKTLKKAPTKSLVEEQADAEAQAAVGSRSPPPTLIRWVRTTPLEAETHLIATIRDAMWFFYLSCRPDEEHIGVESADAAPVLFQDAPPKSIK